MISGFSGNGMMELDVVSFLLEIEEPALLVVDCNWNMQGPMIANRTIPLVKAVRAKYPTLPIVLAE